MAAHDSIPGRALLLMSLVVCMGGTVILENPASSILFQTKYFLDWVRKMNKVGLRAPWFNIMQRS